MLKSAQRTKANGIFCFFDWNPCSFLLSKWLSYKENSFMKPRKCVYFASQKNLLCSDGYLQEKSRQKCTFERGSKIAIPRYPPPLIFSVSNCSFPSLRRGRACSIRTSSPLRSAHWPWSAMPSNILHTPHPKLSKLSLLFEIRFFVVKKGLPP